MAGLTGPRRISGSKAPRNKLWTTNSIFETRLFNRDNLITRPHGKSDDAGHVAGRHNIQT